MSRLLIRDFEDDVMRELERRAKGNGRTLEDEVIEILREVLDEEEEKKNSASRATS
jgi:plasmid stability protein